MLTLKAETYKVIFRTMKLWRLYCPVLYYNILLQNSYALSKGVKVQFTNLLSSMPAERSVVHGVVSK